MITVFTDGSCDINTRGAKNIGGYCFIVLNESNIKIKEYVGKETYTTNNRMELMAVISAIKHLQSLKEEIVIHSDSQYVVNSINQKWINNWQKNDFKKGKFGKDIPNRDLWIEMWNILKPNIKLKWVKGHNFNIWNEYCDKLVQSVYQKNFTVIN